MTGRSPTGGGRGTNQYRVRGSSTRRRPQPIAHQLGVLEAQANRLAGGEEPDRPSPVPTMAEVREAVQDAQEAIAAAWPGDSAAPRTDLVPAAEVAVCRAGLLIDAVAEARAAPGVAAIAEAYGPNLDSDMAEATAEVARFEAAARELSARYDTMAMEEYVTVWAELSGPQNAAIQRRWDLQGALRERDHLVGEVRAEAALAVLSEIRPMGPSSLEGGLVLHSSSPRPMARVLTEASRFFPTDWLRRSNATNPPLRPRKTTARAHYIHQARVSYKDPSGARALKERTKYFPEGTPPDLHVVRKVGLWTVYQVEVPAKVSVVVSEISIDDDHVAGVDGKPMGTKGLSTAVHEMTHRIEHAHPAVAALGRAHRDRRAREADPNGEMPKPKPIYKNSRRARQEVAHEDHFAHPYMGRVYPNSPCSEVVSTGNEAVFCGRFGGLVGQAGNRADADHRAFVLGLAASA